MRQKKLNVKTCKRALFALYDLRQVEKFARALFNLGWEIVTITSTVKLLTEQGIPATDVGDFVGVKDSFPFPSTLHPIIELALTTDQGKSIDLVYDNTYPISMGIDVGGHTLLALAAKGKRIVVHTVEDMQETVKQLENNHNTIKPSFRQLLIDKALLKISQYYEGLMRGVDVQSVSISKLMNGENPYQIPCHFFQTDSNDTLALGNFQQLSGQTPCFTNMADFDCILHIACAVNHAFEKQYGKAPFFVIAAKHGNPCGLAIDWRSPDRCIDKALWGNPTAIWGGEVIMNFTLSSKRAEKLTSSKKREKFLGSSLWMLDLVVAPEITQDAVQILGKRSHRKIFKNRALKNPRFNEGWVNRPVRGGFLRQPPHNYILDLRSCRADFSFPPSEAVDSLIIAWAVAWHSSLGGNEVAIAKDRALITAGGGPSTVEACRTAVSRSAERGRELEGSFFAADAFFPFTDGPDALIKAGCAGGLVPEGGKNSKIVKKVFRQNNVNVYFLPEEFRGFCRH